jgi:hypothetical protein
MIELLLIIVTAAACKFLHYCIGSPIQGEFYSGRIFSAYGKWLSNKYNKFETKEHKRVYLDYENWKKERDLKLQADLEGKTAEQSQIIWNEFLSQVEAVYNDIESNKKVNPYSALGACPICFSTWVSLFLYVFYIIFVPVSWFWVFIGTPAAVILSRYIKIQ